MSGSFVSGSFLSDQPLCERRAQGYWGSLRSAAMRRVSHQDSGNLPLMASSWPLMVYSKDLAFPSVNEWLDQESGWFDGNLLCTTGIADVLGDKAPDRCQYQGVAVSEGLGQKLADALALISQYWPEGAKEIAATIRGFAFVISAKSFSSTSDPKIFGLIHLDQEFYQGRSVAELATALIHETGHHALFIESARVRLINEPGKILYSPLRKENRPAIGVLHASVALYRMISWGKKIMTSCPEEAQRIQSQLVPKYKATMEELAAIEFLEGGIPMKRDLEQLSL